MQLDYTVLMFINGLSGHGVWLDRLIANFSQYGPLIFGAYLIWLWFSGSSPAERDRSRKNALYALLSAILAMGINQAIGFMWYRNRPFVDHRVNQLVSATQDASFPSDHAAGSFSIAGSALLGQSWGGAALTCLALLLSISRVYVGVHYPSDILGGMAVGLISSIIVDKNRDLLEKPIALVLSCWNFIEANTISRNTRNTRLERQTSVDEQWL